MTKETSSAAQDPASQGDPEMGGRGSGRNSLTDRRKGGRTAVPDSDGRPADPVQIGPGPHETRAGPHGIPRSGPDEDAAPTPHAPDGRAPTAGAIDPAEADAHAAKKARIKAARDRMMATKTGEKGLIIVLTGPGKGKSSSAFGMILRAIAHGMPCAVVQFIKGAMATGERDLLVTHFGHLCRFHTMGEGFTWETQDLARDRAAARAGWQTAKALIRDPAIRMVLLDEIAIALRYDYLDAGEVAAFLRDEKPPMTHVVLTGRNAPPAILEIADLVTEMQAVKHPFRAGIKAQPGVEF